MAFKPNTHERQRVVIFSPRPESDPFAITEEVFARAAERNSQFTCRIEWSVTHTHEELEGLIGRAAILLAFDFPREDLTERAPNLQWIHVPAAGVEHLLPLGWLPRSIALTNSRGAHARKSGEFAAMALLMLNARMPLFATNQRKRLWADQFSGSIAGKTVLVIGLGSLGGAAARAAKQLGMRVIGVRRSGRAHADADQVLSPGRLREALPHADFLYIAAALTPETKNLIGAEQLDRLKPSCGVVNVGRAAILDTAALIGKLRRGELSGAILDVFEQEPLPSTSPLWSTPNLVVVPHTSSTDLDSYVDTVLDGFFLNLGRLLAGRRLANRVSRSWGY